MDVAAIEKRRCNRLISEHCRFDRGLDAFAGVGISAYYWARCTQHLYLVEKRKDALNLLQRNLRFIEYRDSSLELVGRNVHDFLLAAAENKLTFDFIDCDPFGGCHELLPVLSRVMVRGVLCMTTGEIYQVYRGLNRKPGRNGGPDYRGVKVLGWVFDEAIPEVINSFRGAKLIHFYVYPSSLRMIFAIGGYPAYAQWFARRPNFLGWLSDIPVSVSQHKL
jgi:N2,N2-dimethylguanosine tRNA methyltransferase